ncbi:MAG: hypothetical protein ACKVPX_00060 [Myxococcaceae bacterium]
MDAMPGARYRGTRMIGRREALFLLAMLPGLAWSADVTRIASSAEDNHPFGLFLDVGYSRTQHNAGIARESYAGGTLSETRELDFVYVDSRLNFDMRIGLWTDLELHIGLPYVLSQSDAYALSAGQTPGSSSLTRSCFRPNGDTVNPGCAADPSLGDPFVTVPNINFRRGLGNAVFGLAYAPFRQSKDSSKPTWIIAFEWETPTASRRNLAAITAAVAPTAVGDKTHRFTFSTALSRRYGIVEPYVRVNYTLAHPGPAFYSNCDRTDLNNLGNPDQCGAITRAEAGLQPPHLAGFWFGAELTPGNASGKGTRFTLDLRGRATYVSSGRYYNEVSALFQKLMRSGDYVQLDASLALVVHITDLFTARARAGYGMQTARFLSAEDMNGAAGVPNPNFDYRLDLPSQRLRIVDNGLFTTDLSVSLNF